MMQRNGTEVVDGVTLAESTTSDVRAVTVDIAATGWRPVLTTPKGNAPMRVMWMRFTLYIPSGALVYGVEFGGGLIDDRDIARRKGVGSMRRTVKTEDLAERAHWSLAIVERFRPPYVEVR